MRARLGDECEGVLVGMEWKCTVRGVGYVPGTPKNRKNGNGRTCVASSWNKVGTELGVMMYSMELVTCPPRCGMLPQFEHGRTLHRVGALLWCAPLRVSQVEHAKVQQVWLRYVIVTGSCDLWLVVCQESFPVCVECYHVHVSGVDAIKLNTHLDKETK